jgi:hypothetical protein
VDNPFQYISIAAFGHGLENVAAKRFTAICQAMITNALLGFFNDVRQIKEVSNPNYPFVLDVVNLGPGSQPHVAGLTEDEVVTDYFLNEDDFGKIHYEGDHKVHVLRVQRARLEIDYRFNLDFNTAIATSRPHGIAIK